MNIDLVKADTFVYARRESLYLALVRLVIINLFKH